MATSGSYSFSVTRDDIIRTAMLFLGKLDDVELPTPTETTDMSRLLNLIVKQWSGKADMAPGLKTWTRKRGYLFLQGNAYEYQLGPTAVGWTNQFTKSTLAATALSGVAVITVVSSMNMAAGNNIGVQLDNETVFWTTIASITGSAITLSAPLPSQASLNNVVYVYSVTAQQPDVIEAVVLRYALGNDVPLRIMTQIEYDSLPAKTQPGYVSQPTAVYPEWQLGATNIYLDIAGVSDVTQYLVFTYMEMVQDFLNPLDTPEYPQEWFLPLCWELAKQANGMFRAIWTQDMEMNYQKALAIAGRKEPDRTVAYFMCGED